MEAINQLLDQAVVQKIGWTLVHFVWQAGVIAVVLAVILKMLKKQSANLRYLIACGGLLLVLACPLVTINMIKLTDFEPVKPAEIMPFEGSKVIADVEFIEPLAEKEITPVLVERKIALKERFMQGTEAAMPYFVMGWIVGVFGLSLWHLGGWTQLQKLRRRMVSPVSERVNLRLRHLTERMGVKRAVNIMESALVSVPMAIGHLKPIILLPATAITGLSSKDIEAIIAHELAHIKRCDYLVNIFQTVVEIVGFYHPAVWWLSHKIRVERENCCDDIAVKVCSDNLNYAKALATMEEIRAGRIGLAVAASGGNLLDRIKRLLGKDNTNEHKLSWLPSVIAVLLVLSMVIPASIALNSSNNDNEPIIVSGHVLSEDTKEPIKGAIVRVAIPGTDMRKIRSVENINLLETISDKSGYFKIEITSDKNEKDVSVDVFSPGYRSAAGTYRSGGDFSLHKLPLDKQFNNIRTNLKILLPKAKYIKGVVKNHKGSVFPGVIVTGLMRDKDGYGYIAKVVTNEKGEFEIFDYPIGKLPEEKGELTFEVASAEAMTISDIYELSKDELKNLDITMSRGLTISGILLDSQGLPKNGTLVEAVNGIVLKETETNQSGYFKLEGLDNGSIELRAYAKDIKEKIIKPVFLSDKDLTVDLQMESVELKKQVEEIEFLGMKVANINDELKNLYDIHHSKGVVILNPGLNHERLGIGKLKEGYHIWMIGNKKISNIKDMISKILSINSKPNPTAPGMIYEGHKGFVRIVYSHTKGSNTQYLKLSEADTKALIALAKQLGIEEYWQKDGSSTQEEFKVYQVNRSVADFPEEEDFSTPESAYAAINRVMATDDRQGWVRVSRKSLTNRLSKLKKKSEVDPEWANVVLNAKILEVRIHGNEAVVLAKYPQKLSRKPIESPIDYRHLTFEDGKWLNTGQNRYQHIENARSKFDKGIEEKKRAEQAYSNALDKSEMFKEMAEELFEGIRKTNYKKVLSYYNKETGDWKRDGWKKVKIWDDYMVHTNWPAFSLWVCKTFKENPIVKIELGDLFISEKKNRENYKLPAVPYKLVLSDGGILEGELYFYYWARSDEWQAGEGIDWHLMKDPIKRVNKPVINIKDRLIVPGIEENSEYKQQILSDNFKATLPNGVTVKLLGICEHPSEGKQWWRPDGILTKKSFAKLNSPNIEPLGDRYGINMFLKYTGADVRKIGFKWKSDDGWTDATWPIPEHNLRGMLLQAPLGVKQVDISLGLASGDWMDAADCGVHGGGRHLAELPEASVVFHPPYRKTGKTCIDVTYGRTDFDLRLLAVDKTGQKHQNVDRVGGIADKFVSFRFVFDLPIEEIESFILQRRPYQWVTFKNVCLKPNFKTDGKAYEKATVHGQITQNGKPMVNARVIAEVSDDNSLGKNPSTHFETHADQQGYYTIEGLPSGELRVAVMTDKGNLNVAQKVLPIAPNRTLELNFGDEQGYSVSGLVTLDGKPIELAKIVMTGAFKQYTSFTKFAWTDNNGKFLIKGLQPGIYKTLVHNTNINPDTFTFEEGQTSAAHNDIDVNDDLRLNVNLSSKLRSHKNLNIQRVTDNNQRYFVTIVAGSDKDKLGYQGQQITWEKLEAKLRNLPNKEVTVLEVAFEPEAIPKRRSDPSSYIPQWLESNEAFKRAGQLVKELGLEYLSFVGPDHPSTRRGPISIRTEDKFNLDEEILVGLRSFEEKPLLYLKSVTFDRNLRATLKLSATSYPHKFWEIGIRLLNEQGQQIDSVVKTYDNKGMALGSALNYTDSLEFDFDRIDIKAVDHFEVKLREFLKPETINDKATNNEIVPQENKGFSKPIERVIYSSEIGKEEIEISGRFIKVSDINEIMEIAADKEEDLAEDIKINPENTKALIIDDEQKEAILRYVQIVEDTVLITAPRALVIDGEIATVRSQKLLYYDNVNSDTGEKETKELKVGTMMMAKPKLTDEGKNILLELELEQKDIIGGHENIPEIEVNTIKSKVKMPEGKTIIMILKREKDKNLICMVGMKKVDG